MKNNYTYLRDTDFLKILASENIKEYFVKIIALNWNEEPIQNIQGKVLSASFNIDANSIVRRTATLNVLMEGLINNITNVQNLLSINKKINLEIGFINTTSQYKNYNILWFPLGVYVINSCSISNTQSGITASLQLKDKMCLLNGECGGVLPASTVFDNYETVDENGEWIISRPPMYQIIQELVNHFGGEQLGKIIIADLDTRVKQVMKWTGSSPLYFLQKADQYYMTIDNQDYINHLSQGFINIDGSPFEYGQDVGFIFTDFTYPGDLIGDPGSTITDILEKIKDVLGNYEYFYDIDGNFVFQEVKNYLNNSHSQYISRSFKQEEKQFVPDYINSVTDSSLHAYIIDQSQGKSTFTFDDSNLIISYNNTPQYNMIKNDFMIWGIRTVDGLDIPIRYHLAIDKKPEPGNTYSAIAYTDPDDDIEKWSVPINFNYSTDSSKPGIVGAFYKDTTNNKIYRWESNNNKYDYYQKNVKLENITTKDWRTELYFQGVVAQPFGLSSNYYYSELLNEWPKLYDIRKGKMREEATKNPSGIDFYLDFIDSSSILGEFSVDNIGRRSKVLNENKNVNCVFEPYIPDVVLINKDYSGTETKSLPAKLRQECEARGQQFYQVPNSIYEALEIGGMLNSAYDVIRQLIHQYTSYNNSISIQTLPLYHLEPNTRITVNDSKSNIYGDYMITNMTFNVDVSSTLTISAVKALEKI